MFQGFFVYLEHMLNEIRLSDRFDKFALNVGITGDLFRLERLNKTRSYRVNRKMLFCKRYFTS